MSYVSFLFTTFARSTSVPWYLNCCSPQIAYIYLFSIKIYESITDVIYITSKKHKIIRKIHMVGFASNQSSSLVASAAPKCLLGSSPAEDNYMWDSQIMVISLVLTFVLINCTFKFTNL